MKFWPLAADIGMRYGINPGTILAVGAQESGCGTSYSARNRRNYFGLRGAKGWKVFATDAECFEFFGQLLARRYEAAALVSGNIAAFTKRMAATRYVSGSASEKALWGRNVAAYWRRFTTLATVHGLRPSAPVLAATSTPITRG
ncbi:glucosaminidase domain-containing protein [Hymenobacter cheonanensis]|uniref:glucosaminidase domain-containing protein n=1 Tax=Hymenobacter sp. CA2-7 TaxID=3063993 RepID=UPI0027140D35|nr:glucosaminidase domain-containing protein [Hymenobacter sp. CA2-7]MDO7886837.1 glucosaminidase domain-containing protein [Hymenobacter sp. CA2-7]